MFIMLMQKIQVIFSKSGLMKYISHLDLLRLFQRAARRANLPVAVSEGFNPHLKIKIARALKLGEESFNEEALFCLNEFVDPRAFKTRLQSELPQGIEIRQAREV